MEDYSNKIANLFMKRFGLKKGDAVALFLENKPEYVATWLGLSKIGVISALINTNLKSQALVHSIKIAQPKAIIYGAELKDCKRWDIFWLPWLRGLSHQIDGSV